MQPQQVYNCVKQYKGISTSTICKVKTQCLRFNTCNNKSNSSVLDFDNAAKTYQTEKGLKNTPQSVDALTIDKKGTLLVLIEKKTWEFFFTKPQKNVNEELKKDAALEKVKKYDLQGKYQSTIDICEHITKANGLFDSLPHVFVFLTEMSDTDPTDGFATMMGDLASTSSIIDYETEKKLVGAMKTHLQSVKCQKSRYVYCEDLDKFLADEIYKL